LTANASRLNKDLAVRYSAQAYDRYTAAGVAHFDDALAARLVGIVAVRDRPPGTLIDVGTGTARFLIRAAVEPGLSGIAMTGVDSFPDMVEEARRAVGDAGLGDRIAIMRADAHDLPFPDESAALVISRSTLHHFHDPIACIREMARIVEPDGMIIIHDVRRDADPEARAAFNRSREALGVPESLAHEKLSVDEIREVISRAGVAHRSVITAPETGPFALGFEIAIHGAGN